MTQPRRQVQIDLNRVLDIVGLATRRASSFMALGLRMSYDESVTSVALDSNFQIQFMPLDMALEKVREVQSNFRPWIIGNGLRELDQGTSIFADRVYEARTLAEFHNQIIPKAPLDRIRKFQDRTNVAAKLGVIADQFAIDSPHRVHMAGLSKARNALSHNMGVVGQRHCTQENELRISWMGWEMLAGDRVIADAFEPFRVEQGEKISMRMPLRERSIPMGSPIDLSPHDLHEICLTYWFQAQSLVRELSRQVQEYVRPAK